MGAEDNLAQGLDDPKSRLEVRLMTWTRADDAKMYFELEVPTQLGLGIKESGE